MDAVRFLVAQSADSLWSLSRREIVALRLRVRSGLWEFKKLTTQWHRHSSETVIPRMMMTATRKERWRNWGLRRIMMLGKWYREESLPFSRSPLNLSLKFSGNSEECSNDFGEQPIVDSFLGDVQLPTEISLCFCSIWERNSCDANLTFCQSELPQHPPFKLTRTARLVVSLARTLTGKGWRHSCKWIVRVHYLKTSSSSLETRSCVKTKLNLEQKKNRVKSNAVVIQLIDR